jgi:hypothetical protein
MKRTDNSWNFGSFTEEDGITGSIDCFDGNDYLTITVTHPDGRNLIEKFSWTWEPRFGIDAGDMDRAEHIADRFIHELRK